MLAALTGITFSTFARENVTEKSPHQTTEISTKKSHGLMKFAIECEPASASADLDINNVRTRILNGGDMWWDLSSARYEIPKIIDVENAVRKNSLFAGSIWIGGEDEGVLKLAAMTYRQSGSDFWPGPLDTVTATTNELRCKAYDAIYKISKDEIVRFVDAGEENGGNYALALPDAPNVASWPAHGNGLNTPYNLAPYFDVNGDDQYNPEEGDYPVLHTECRGVEIDPSANTPADQPDQMLWFVYNDRGNIHTETQALPIGVELQTTAFAYKRNDEINNMTFYTTRIINRGSNILENTYFGQWVDPDLGNYADDYVGCDVGMSLGFCYNGDDNDEGILGYGLNPPSVGVDFFQGPKKDTTINGVDTSIELGMSKFVYYDNDFTNFGNPQSPIHYYNYLRGLWKNGDPITQDCKNGRTGSVPSDYIFPGNSDPNNTLCPNWDEQSAGNTPADRRFLQTSGPFVLKPGAVNTITVGVVWARTSSGGSSGSLELLREASRKAQNIFDNCFNLVSGPNTPDVIAKELNREVILLFTNTNNDKVERYKEKVELDGEEYEYSFQGYRIYQLADATIGTGDIGDIDKVREVFSCDLKDDIVRLVNQEFDPELGQPLPKLKIEGPNQGLIHSLSITEDLFSTSSNKTLVNNKTYYYMIVSYAALPGHPNEEYLEGGDVKFINVTPQKPFGTQINGPYGSIPELQRLEGYGNGGQHIELTQASINTILSEGEIANPIYKEGFGPVNIKVVDPLKVPKGDFEFVLLEDPIPSDVLRRNGVVPENTNWMLIALNNPKDDNDNDTIFSDYTIDVDNEQLIVSNEATSELQNWGLAVQVKQVLVPGNAIDKNNGLISWEVQWEDNSRQWLTAIPDFDNPNRNGVGWYDWIRSGSVGRNELSTNPDPSWQDYFLPNTTNSIDQFEIYEKIWDGRLAPYRLASRNRGSGAGRPDNLNQGPAFDGARTPNEWGYISNISSVDIVLTPDESKWTKVLVLELGEEPSLNEGGVNKFDIRDHYSLNKDGSLNTSEKGRSWFPGYAIDLETGKRLNIIIGEDSYQKGNNGDDMKWNPTDDGGLYTPGYPSFGGRHYIYIMGYNKGFNPVLFDGATEYDECKHYMDIINGTGFNKDIHMNNKVMFQCSWLIPAYMAQGYKMKLNKNNMPVPPTELTFKLRVNKPYTFYNPYDNPDQPPYDPRITNDRNPRYTFNTDAVFTEKSVPLGESSMDEIRAVPNPYFAFSAYESSPVDNRIKITNLPEKCVVSIYTIDGALVRRINKDDPSTELQWDIKNAARVPVASGTYLIHVKSDTYGEAVIKWLGIMRELDLDSF